MRLNLIVLSAFFRSLLFVLIFCFSAALQAQDNGLLWKLQSPQGKTSYLFGTMHTDDRKVTDISPEVEASIKGSEIFLMEMQPPVDPSFYFMKEGRLDHMLTEQEFVEVIKLADFHSMHTDIATKMKPWLLAVIFDLPKPQTPYTLDAMLMSLAQRHSKPIRGLETVEEHFTILDSFGMGEQLIMLRSVLKRTHEERVRNYEELVRTYLSGELERITQVNAKQSGDALPPELWNRILAKLLDERNDRMAERIQRYASEHSVFIAVGAAHLPGENGLLNQLRRLGYQVSPVK